jgi:FkbM family methyltransferase
MQFHKTVIKYALSSLGYELRRTRNLGLDPFKDMSHFVTSSTPVLFDVGANVGQTIKNLRQHFKQSTIHAFEPSPSTFQTLRERTLGITGLHLINAGLGAHPEIKTFVENQSPDISSFLEPGQDCWGSVKQRLSFRLDTIDEYCERAGVQHIDVLKSDTQGFELEVLRGASRMFEQKRIRLIYLEIIFSAMYQGLPGIDEVFKFLFDHGFRVVSFYDMHYQNGLLSWTDVLFVDPAYSAETQFCCVQTPYSAPAEW